MKLTDGYTPFGSPIVLDSGKRIEAWYPKLETDRRWMVWVVEGDTPIETEYVSLGTSAHGPSLDDVLKLEATTNRLVEHYS